MNSVKYSIMILLLFLQMFSSINAQDGEPCGPARVLDSGIASNVAQDSRCFELRFYTANPTVGEWWSRRCINDFVRGNEFLTTHGAELIGYWLRLDNPSTIVWLLAFRDRAHRDKVFSSFRADPEWLALRQKYNVPVQRELFFMSATDYSALK